MTTAMWMFGGLLVLLTLVCLVSAVLGQLSLGRLRRLIGRPGFDGEAELQAALFAVAVYAAIGIFVVAVAGTAVDLAFL